MDKLSKGEGWESQVESAYMAAIEAAYSCFMALDMDKDVSSHTIVGTETWLKLDTMMQDHNDLMTACLKV